MPKGAKTKPRAKRRTKSENDVTPFRLVGQADETDRIQEDHGSEVRMALIESIGQQLYRIPTHFLVEILGTLSHCAGTLNGRRKMFPGFSPPKDLD